MKGHGGGAAVVDGEVNAHDEGEAVGGLEDRVVNCIIA